MSQNNDSVNYTSDDSQREHKEWEKPRFGRGGRGAQEENGENPGQNPDQNSDKFKGPNKDSNKPGPGPEKNYQNNQENSEISPENLAHPEDQNQDQTFNKDDKPDENDGQHDEPNENGSGKNNESDENGGSAKENEFDGREKNDQWEGGHWRDDKSDGQSERGGFDENGEECERPEPEENEEECEPQNPELDQQGNPHHPNGSHQDFPDDGRDHSDRGPGHHLPPGDRASQTPSYRPGFMERTSAYTLTFSNETMFEVLLGSLLILVSAVFLFIYMVKRKRRKTMRSQYPVQNLRFVTPNQNIATANFYQYYQKEGSIPTGTVVGFIPEGQFLQSGAKNVQNLKSFGRLPTQDEILDLS